MLGVKLVSGVCVCLLVGRRRRNWGKKIEITHISPSVVFMVRLISIKIVRVAIFALSLPKNTHKHRNKWKKDEKVCVCVGSQPTNEYNPFEICIHLTFFVLILFVCCCCCSKERKKGRIIIKKWLVSSKQKYLQHSTNITDRETECVCHLRDLTHTWQKINIRNIFHLCRWDLVTCILTYTQFFHIILFNILLYAPVLCFDETLGNIRVIFFFFSFWDLYSMKMLSDCRLEWKRFVNVTGWAWQSFISIKKYLGTTFFEGFCNEKCLVRAGLSFVFMRFV